MKQMIKWKQFIAGALLAITIVTGIPVRATGEEGVSEGQAQVVIANEGNSPYFSDSMLAHSAQSVPETNSGAVILVEANTRQVIYEKNSSEKMYPASTTKVMTALLTYENVNLDDVVTTTASAVHHNTLIPDGSSASLKVGEEITVRNLLYGLLLPSGNDAACVLAEYVGGTVENFVEMMNVRAKELGCINTHFANPHGLTNENHYTTAHDLYCIAYEFAKHEELMEIANTTSITIPATNQNSEQTHNTTNHLISTRKYTQYFYEYARGVKTGYTSAAKHCLVSTALKDDMYLICIVLKSPVLEGNVVTSFMDSKALYEWGFATYELRNILKKGSSVTEAYVTLSEEKDSVILETNDDIRILIPRGSYDESLLTINPPKTVATLTAPIAKGDLVAEATVIYDNVDCGKIGLVTASSAALSEFMDMNGKTEDFFNSKIFVVLLIAIPVVFVFYIIYITLASKRRRRRSVYGRRYR
ncbi:MAG: D-alanyl-D-alanine carboxypeptidase [Clostridia bacterium]|nr:D-alanyl-D-alanine carboxypeptidase [Clostridia bacterium]